MSFVTVESAVHTGATNRGNRPRGVSSGLVRRSEAWQRNTRNALRTDERVVGLQVLLERVHDEDVQLVRVVEEQRGGQVADFFVQQVGLVSHLHSVDVPEAGVMAEHLDVNEPDDVLSHAVLVQLGIDETLLQEGNLRPHDGVLIRLGLALAWAEE